MRKSPLKKRASLTGYVLFFLTTALTVTVAITLFALINRRTAGDKKMIALSMFVVILAISAVFTGIDVLRRKIMIDQPVELILQATQRIAQGDFEVQLEARHPYGNYDDYDLIIENINAMAKELKKSEVLKTDFISNVSHELKTPLAVIQNYAFLLEKEKAEDKRKEYAHTMVEATKRLNNLVGNILKLNKLENQSLRLQYEKISLADALADGVVALEEAIERKGLELECDLQEVFVFSEKSYLEIVWNNLLSNAVKFTDEGKITVRCYREGDKAKVKIKDSGCGIDAEQGARIFEKFYQGDTSHSGEGNGLGLALVKKVIGVVGGEIAVESVLGEGSEFTVTLQAVDG